jgi:phage host-nuclease inhibitor protein Gam
MSDIVERLRSVTDLQRETERSSYEQDDQLALEAADTITRLTAEVETVGAMHRDACELAKHRMQEVERLRATNERLRKMLWEVNEQCPEHVPVSLLNQIRAALKGK